LCCLAPRLSPGFLPRASSTRPPWGPASASSVAWLTPPGERRVTLPGDAKLPPRYTSQPPAAPPAMGCNASPRACPGARRRRGSRGPRGNANQARPAPAPRARKPRIPHLLLKTAARLTRSRKPAHAPCSRFAVNSPLLPKEPIPTTENRRKPSKCPGLWRFSLSRSWRITCGPATATDHCQRRSERVTAVGQGRVDSGPCACAHAHMCVSRACTLARANALLHAWLHACLVACLHACRHALSRKHPHTRAHMHMCMCARKHCCPLSDCSFRATCLCVCVCVNVCACVRAYAQIHTHAHTQTFSNISLTITHTHTLPPRHGRPRLRPGCRLQA
jgi:hypothetical protein